MTSKDGEGGGRTLLRKHAPVVRAKITALVARPLNYVRKVVGGPFYKRTLRRITGDQYKRLAAVMGLSP
jgi:hypothetical protein